MPLTEAKIERSTSPWSSFALFILTVLTCVAGCGDSSRATVSGQVKLDGQPITLGAITFIPAERGQGKATGGAIQDGRFRLEGAAAPAIGKYRVEIRATRNSGRMVQPAFARSGEELVEGTEEAVAAEYNDRSTLEFEIKAGSNEANWDVESRG